MSSDSLESKPGAANIDHARALAALAGGSMNDGHLREFVENHKTSIAATVDLMLANKTLPLNDMTGADVDHIVKLAIEAHLRLAIYSE